MMVVLLIAGIGLLLAGLLTVGFGIQLDLSFGNTLIFSGTVAACTGMIMLSLWAVVRELKKMAWRLGPGVSTELHAGSRAASGAPRHQAAENGGFLFSGDQQAAEEAGDLPSASPPSVPWQEEESAARERGASAPEPAEAAPAVKPRRNLLFSSSSRKERERAPGRTADPAAADLRPAPPAPESSEVPPPPFDDAWPKLERSRADAPLPRRGGRTASSFTAANAGADRYAPAGRNGEQPPVTVLKSGVVDGMAYSLYSDGSIEAQMPEGMMRFASIDELRAHLDQRP
jgi:hypothetical protein